MQGLIHTFTAYTIIFVFLFIKIFFSRQGFYVPQLTMNYVAEIGAPFSLPQAPM